MTCPKCTGALPAAGMSRRAVLSRFGMGLGGIALANLVNPAQRLRARRPQDRGVLGGQLHLPAKAKRVIYLFMAGGPSQMETFDYKPVLRQRNGEQLPDSVRQGQRLTGMSGNQSSLAARRVAVRVQSAREERHLGQRPPAPHREDRRRALHRPLDVHRGDQSRPRDHVLPDRLADRRPAEHGLVDSLRARQRQRGPAGVCRAHHARQGRSAALLPPLGQRIPAGAASGRAVPERQGRGVVPGESGRRDAREPAAGARSAYGTCTRTPPRRSATRKSTPASPSTRCRTGCRRACPA